jgi:two-component system, chemotaxis family, response regulator Rcp1
LLAQRHILVVEDNPGDVRLMREALNDVQPPITLDICLDADQARQRLQDPHAPKPRLILLDFNLPKSGSKDFLRFLKSDETLRLIPVAVLTTSDAERDVSEAYRLHANCYLRKPVDLDGFFEVIRSAAHFWLDVACLPK